MEIVIVGNGAAGMEAAIEARRHAPSATITVISEETDHFFSRPSLMYLLAGQLRLSDVEPMERDAYAAHRLVRVRGRAVGLDVAGRQVLLSGERRLPYDRLLIASGSMARPGPWPGSDLRGVGAFVTMADLAWLEDELGITRSGVAPSEGESPYGARRTTAKAGDATAGKQRRAVVIGGGLIGIEVAESLLALGLRPRFFIREDAFWPMALDPREAAWIGEHMRSHGVDVHLATEVERLLGNDAGELCQVETNVGVFDADLAAVAIGLVPNTAWLGASVELEPRSRAVLVDGQLTSTAPDVYAAGDCAAVRWYDGTQRPELLWYTARDQGRVAGRRLAGLDANYQRGLWYNSAKLFDIEYTTVGRLGELAEGLGKHTEFFAEERGRVRSSMRLSFSDGGLVGANLLGRRWDHEVFLTWIQEGRALPYVQKHLSEAAFDTEFVPPLATATLIWAEA